MPNLNILNAANAAPMNSTKLFANNNGLFRQIRLNEIKEDILKTINEEKITFDKENVFDEAAVKIGTWINGKTLYRYTTTIEGIKAPETGYTTQRGEKKIEIPGVESIVEIDTCAGFGNGITRPLPFIDIDKEGNVRGDRCANVGCIVDSTGITLYWNVGGAIVVEPVIIYVILYYTLV